MGLVNHGYTRERNLSPAAPSSRMLKQTPEVMKSMNNPIVLLG